MSSNLVPAQPTPSNSMPALHRPDKALAKALTGLEHQRVVGLARIEVAAQHQAAKVEAVEFVTKRAMNAVAMISQEEVQLAQLCPAAVTRLQSLADMGALTLAQVISDTRHRLG